MSLVVMLTDLESGATIGRPDSGVGGWCIKETLRRDDFEGFDRLRADAAWPAWEDRRVEVRIASTEAHPSWIRWIRWHLSADLADDLFGHLGDF